MVGTRSGTLIACRGAIFSLLEKGIFFFYQTNKQTKTLQFLNLRYLIYYYTIHITITVSHNYRTNSTSHYILGSGHHNFWIHLFIYIHSLKQQHTQSNKKCWWMFLFLKRQEYPKAGRCIDTLSLKRPSTATSVTPHSYLQWEGVGARLELGHSDVIRAIIIWAWDILFDRKPVLSTGSTFDRWSHLAGREGLMKNALAFHYGNCGIQFLRLNS